MILVILCSFTLAILQGKSLTLSTSDSPIYIHGNEQLAAFANKGEGTKNDPYIIENYTITTSSNHGVEIRNTTEYFILRNVTVDGTGSNNKYGFFFFNVTNGIIKDNVAFKWAYGFRFELSCHNVLIGNSASYCYYYGFYLSYDRYNPNYISNNTLTNNIASYNGGGFCLWESSHNTLTNNDANNNGLEGFYLLFFSSNNSLIYNNAYKNGIGIRLKFCGNNSLINNSASNNYDDGLRLLEADHNTLIHNIANANYGNGFNLYHHAYFNTMTNNIATCNNKYGFSLQSSSNNLLFFNSIQQNRYQIFSNRANTWHNGTHGNYWGDYTGNDSNNDQVGDTPYSIDGGDNEDPFPLMIDPFQIPILLCEFTSSKSYTYTSASSDYNVDFFFFGLISLSVIVLHMRRSKI